MVDCMKGRIQSTRWLYRLVVMLLCTVWTKDYDKVGKSFFLKNFKSVIQFSNVCITMIMLFGHFDGSLGREKLVAGHSFSHSENMKSFLYWVQEESFDGKG